MLLGVQGVGQFASVLWSEGLSRHFDNRRQVAAYAGLAPAPWQSGSVNREQGISQSGNPRLRTTMIQLVALWKYVSAGVVIEGAMIRAAWGASRLAETSGCGN